MDQYSGWHFLQSLLLVLDLLFEVDIDLPPISHCEQPMQIFQHVKLFMKSFRDLQRSLYHTPIRQIVMHIAKLRIRPLKDLKNREGKWVEARNVYTLMINDSWKTALCYNSSYHYYLNSVKILPNVFL